MAEALSAPVLYRLSVSCDPIWGSTWDLRLVTGFGGRWTTRNPHHIERTLPATSPQGFHGHLRCPGVVPSGRQHLNRS